MNKITKLFQGLIKFFQEIFSPAVCLSCGRRLTIDSQKIPYSICRPCFEKIEINSGFYCPQCLRRLPGPQKSCHQETSFILGAASSYQNEVVRQLIHILKYQGVREAAEILTLVVELYFQKSKLDEFLADKEFLLIPLPLHPRRKRQRGFNQTEILAQFLISPSKPFLKLEKQALLRIKNTLSQTKLANIEERRQNVAGCFSVKNPELIRGKNILLLDDVFTSGSTIKEAVRVLRKAGAKKIISLVVAKA